MEEILIGMQKPALLIHEGFLTFRNLVRRGVRSRGAQCAYAPPVSKEGGHMPPLRVCPP